MTVAETPAAELFAQDLEWSRRHAPVCSRHVDHARHALACAITVQIGLAHNDADLGAAIREIWAIYEKATR